MLSLEKAILFLILGLASVSALNFPRHSNDDSASSVTATLNATSSSPTSSVARSRSSSTSELEHASTRSESCSSVTDTATSSNPSSTTSSAENASKSASNSTSSNSSAASVSELFPGETWSPSSDTWSTSSQVPNALPLDDTTLGVTKLLKALSHDYVTAPDGTYSMEAVYPKGSYTFGHDPQGGFSFYALGPSDFNLTSAKEATFAYSVYFEDGFDFVKGGKLPGLYGGDDATTAVSCSGGRRDDSCWSARFMWRTAGAGELYTYLPPDYAANKAVCSVPPFSTCNAEYGASVGRGSFTFKAGARTTIGQRVLLNDAGVDNGELELFVDGKSMFVVKGLRIRDSDAGRIYGLQMQTFFGGSDPSFASTKEQHVYFADFSVAITQKL